MTTDNLLRTVAPQIGEVGGKFYFAPATLAVGKALGLDGFRWYVVGRAGVLGDVEAPVVGAAFGYFAPALIDKLWTSAKETVAPRDAARRYHECCADYGRATFGALSGLDAYNEAAEKVIAHADRDGLSLFAGWAAEPLVDDAPGRAMQLTAVLRELRGSAHLAAVLASGLRPRNAHFVKRPEMVASFGYSPDDVQVNDGDAEKLATAERLTDVIVGPAFASLSDAEAAALQAGASALHAAAQ